MTTQAHPADSWLAATYPDLPTTQPEDVPPRRRARGLRFPVVPSGPLLAQIGGGVAALCGAYAQFGAGVTLIAGGVAAAVLGALREAGKI